MTTPKSLTILEQIIKSLKEEEEELTVKIIRKTTIINYLTVELETAVKMKEYYEKRLKDIGDSIVNICNK